MWVGETRRSAQDLSLIHQGILSVKAEKTQRVYTLGLRTLPPCQRSSRRGCAVIASFSGLD